MTELSSINRQKGISGSALKLVACAAMLLDHIGASLLEPIMIQAARSAGVTDWSYVSLIKCCPNSAVLYCILRLVGRIAFPIFCFLLVEGFFHTTHLLRYCLRLALFALASEIPFDLAFHRTPFYWNYQNVFFTLLIGLLSISAMEYTKKRLPARIWMQAVCRVVILLCGMWLALFLKTDYSHIGVLTIVIFYLFYEKRTFSLCLSCVVLSLMAIEEITAFAAVPLVKCYNGTRGISLKYAFYVFYPLHLLLLFFVGTLR